MRRSVFFTSLLLLAGCAGSHVAAAPVIVPRPAVASGDAPTAVPEDAPLAKTPDDHGDTGDHPLATAGSWIGANAESDFLRAGVGDANVGVWVDAPLARAHHHVPMDIALAIDTSGSMAGAKIDNARKAAQLLIDQLADGDIVSIDTFADTAKTVAEPTMLSAATRTQLSTKLVQLVAAGSTGMFDGLGLAEMHASRAPATHAVRRVVVISDGKANVGPSSPEALGALAERGLRVHTQITSLGVGVDYDERTLNALAERSSGRLYHLSEPKELASLLKRELDLLSSTVATDAFVEIVPASGVEILGAEGIRVESLGSGAVRLSLGALFAGQHREALVRVRIRDTRSAPSRALASVRLHFRDPDDSDLERVQEVVARAAFSTDDAAVARSGSARTRSIAALLDASKLELVAVDAVNGGRFADASDKLAAAQANLEAQAASAGDDTERARLATAAKAVARTRASVSASASAPAAAQRDEALKMNAGAMQQMGY